MSSGTLASFAVKRRPVGCASDSVWRSVGSCGMATADHEMNCVDNMFNKDPDINCSSVFFNVGSSFELSRFDASASGFSCGLWSC